MSGLCAYDVLACWRRCLIATWCNKAAYKGGYYLRRHNVCLLCSAAPAHDSTPVLYIRFRPATCFTVLVPHLEVLRAQPLLEVVTFVELLQVDRATNHLPQHQGSSSSRRVDQKPAEHDRWCCCL
jgi:hypothetical protein